MAFNPYLDRREYMIWPMLACVKRDGLPGESHPVADLVARVRNVFGPTIRRPEAGSGPASHDQRPLSVRR